MRRVAAMPSGPGISRSISTTSAPCSASAASASSPPPAERDDLDAVEGADQLVEPGAHDAVVVADDDHGPGSRRHLDLDTVPAPGRERTSACRPGGPRGPRPGRGPGGPRRGGAPGSRRRSPRPSSSTRSRARAVVARHAHAARASASACAADVAERLAGGPVEQLLGRRGEREVGGHVDVDRRPRARAAAPARSSIAAARPGVVQAAGVDLDHRGAQAADALARGVGAVLAAPGPWPGRCPRARARRPRPASRRGRRGSAPGRRGGRPPPGGARPTTTRARPPAGASRSRRPSRRRRAVRPGQRQLDQPQQQQRADHDRRDGHQDAPPLASIALWRR